MSKHIFTFAFVVALFAVTTAARAVVTDVHWVPLDGAPAVANSIQNTLFTSMTNDWTNAVVTIKLTAGSLLNPSPSGPTSEWQQLGGPNDTWLAIPYVANGGFPTINLFDQDSPLVPGVDHTFDWFDTTDGGPTSNGIAARIYASTSAMGTFSVQMYDRDSAGVPTQLSGIISGGSFASVPEPTTVVLAGMSVGACLLTLRRRRKS